MIDQKAKKILLQTFWKSGWTDKQTIAPEDFEYAKSKGLMFDPVAFSHDQLVRELLSIRSKVTAKQVGNAFLASLSTRRLDLRSALGTFAVASHFPSHKLSEVPAELCDSGSLWCPVCGLYESSPAEKEDLNVLSFERHKWGGVRHDDPIYVWFDLTQFEKTARPTPTAEDYEILKHILRFAANQPPDGRLTQLAKAIHPLIKSNEAERRTLVEILSLAGVLMPSVCSGFFREFTNAIDRHHTGEHFNDWSYPAIWWRGRDGVTEEAVGQFFPDI